MTIARALPLLLATALVASACTGSRQNPEADAADIKAAAADRPGGKARQVFEALDQHCGRSFAGVVEVDEPAGADPAWASAVPVLHFRACEPALKALSVVRGDDRALVWLMTVREGRLRLQQLNYNDDGTPRPGSHRFSIARADSPAGRLEFEPEVKDSADPAPALTITVEDAALVYESIGDDRRLRVRFDLSSAVPAPAVPWMEAPIR
jgi:hypothetical protein